MPVSKHNRNGNASKERWRDVPGYEGYYQVSDQGRVRSLDRIVPMRDGRNYRVKGKALRASFDGHYYHVVFSKSGREFVHLVHRLVLESFVGPCPLDMEARHFPDRAPANNQLKNLRWSTHTENIQDKRIHGTMRGASKGENHVLAKLTEEQAKSILRRGLSGESPNQIARDFPICEGTVRDITKGKSWRHLERGAMHYGS